MRKLFGLLFIGVTTSLFAAPTRYILYSTSSVINCSSYANGGKLVVDGGSAYCADDVSGAGGAISVGDTNYVWITTGSIEPGAFKLTSGTISGVNDGSVNTDNVLSVYGGFAVDRPDLGTLNRASFGFQPFGGSTFWQVYDPSTNTIPFYFIDSSNNTSAKWTFPITGASDFDLAISTATGSLSSRLSINRTTGKHIFKNTQGAPMVEFSPVGNSSFTIPVFLSTLTVNKQLTLSTLSNTVLAVNGSGIVVSTTVPGGSGTPAGSSGDVQFNSSGSFGADHSNLFWDNTNKRLGVGTNSPGVDLHVYNSGGVTKLKVDAPLGSYAVFAYGDGAGNEPIAMYRPAGTNNFAFNINSADVLTLDYTTKRVLFGNNSIALYDAMLNVNTPSSSLIGMLIRGASSQSANLQEWQNSSGVTLSSMSASGVYTGYANIAGHTDGSNMTSGYVGYISSANSTNVAPYGGSNVWFNISTVTLPAGNFLITGSGQFSGSTQTRNIIALSIFPDNTSTDQISGITQVDCPLPTASINGGGSLTWIFRSSVPFNVYFKGRVTYAAGSPTISGGEMALQLP